MSSTAYSTEIRPDRQLRCIVLATGGAVVFLGALAIVLMTAPVWGRSAAFAVWAVVSWRELVMLQRGWRCCHGIRLAADGNIEVRNGSRAWEQADLADGSILLRRYGWLRLVTDDGAVIHEPVRGNCREDRDWRRLHVIWRHV